jgi:hypothetical protein
MEGCICVFTVHVPAHVIKCIRFEIQITFDQWQNIGLYFHNIQASNHHELVVTKWLSNHGINWTVP